MIDYEARTGPGGRDENQDREGCYINEDSETYCFVVADGLGGHGGGSAAAKTAVKTVLSHFNECFGKIAEDDLHKELSRAVLNAHHAVREKSDSETPLKRMKTTCVALIISGHRAWWTTIGDSRLYLFRKGTIAYKSRDHSVVQVLLDMKEITEQEVRGHPDRNRLLKALGMKDDLEVKIFREDLEPGDHILLCTDGFWEYFSDQELNDVFVKYPEKPTAEKIEALFKKANTRGKRTDKKHDNLTIQLIRVK